MKVKANNAMLIQNCHASTSGLLKLSAVHSNSAAAARRPTTAGRRPVNTSSTTGWFLNLIRNRLMIIINMKLGRITEKVARNDPSTPAHTGYPALTTAVYPT